MASYDVVKRLAGNAFELIEQKIRMRPTGVGLIPHGKDEYSLFVTLPRRPSVDPPTEIDGVRIEYDVLVSAPTLLGSDVPPWKRRVVGG